MSKIVERKCQACGIIINREELIKITKLQDGSIKINPNSKELGRSIYVCRNKECLKILIKKKRIKTALKVQNQNEISKIETQLLNLF